MQSIRGPLVFLKKHHNAMFGEIVNILGPDGQIIKGKVIKVTPDAICVQAFEDTRGLSVDGTQVKFLSEPFTIGVSGDMIGHTFDGLGNLIDEPSLEIIPEAILDINGAPINPVSRQYPIDVIQTGLSAIDGLNTLVRGQKLPIFSGQGLPHNKLAAQIVSQARVRTGEPFLIIFCGIGILKAEQLYFQRIFWESGAIQNLITFCNLASDPAIERLMVPRIALTTAEFFAFQKNTHVLVVISDMTNYAEALRELSNALEEIPGRKGYPGYMYSDFAAIYERAGRIYGKAGSITQVPIITMPNDDITHPIADLTGYITEGQIVLSREYQQRGIYPPVWCLASLSRLMKESIGEGKTRADHAQVASQLYAAYSRALEVRELLSIVGEENTSSLNMKYLKFGEAFERVFIAQDGREERSFEDTLDIAWRILSILPRNQLVRLDRQLIAKYYVPNVDPNNIINSRRKPLDVV
jgi:V/A-type H+-transporting ATPase subunit B